MTSLARSRREIEAVEIGRVEDLESLPRRVEIASASYFLVRSGDELRLLSAVCPHKGGMVQDAEDHFQCPRHGWRFDYSTGRCLNAPTRSLSSFPVLERGGILYAELPSRALQRGGDRPPLAVPLTFQLHAHACLEIRYRGFTLLTDPWLAGPAFFGSWALWPPPRVDASRLRPDAIWISHEHSDHFHPQTLAQLPRETPVYLPDFPNRRLPARLAALGFTDVRPMPFGETVQLDEDLTLTCFEPASMWNDTILLVEANGFRYLNLNDAGVNHKIAQLVAPVDLISSSFSPGASGYPATWLHLTREEKVAISEQSRQGSLDMLRDATRVYGARYLLPFASFFTLWHPEHRRYLELLRKNAPADVAAAFEDTDVEVIDLFPGEVWNAQNGKRTRLPFEGREHVFDTDKMARYADESWDEAVFQADFPQPYGLGQARVEGHLLRLNETPEMRFCEDLTCVLRGFDGEGRFPVEVAFEVAGHRLRLLPEPPAEPNLTIEVPLGILGQLVQEGLSWDEAFIGYWCRLNRSPNVYHAGFWRLLQAPYYRRAVAGSAVGEAAGARPENRRASGAPGQLPAEGAQELGPDSTIAEVLEAHGRPADLILRRHGLYCFGCSRSPFETIRLGAQKHGLTDHELERLVAELKAALSADAAVGTEAGVQL
jgi:CMP-N-acetylneuraminate monooxygenase